MRTGTHMAVSEAALPLQERVPVKNNNIRRASQLVILFLLVSLLCCRLSSLLRGHGGVSWRAAFLCELWFTFIWLLNMNAKWNPVKYVTYPDRISKRFDDLPAVDMFVTTADPKLEPPLVTVNTVLSLLAVEYPAHKLACYVSDDGCSAVTYYALVEAAEFARSWVPFCKKYHVGVRAPSVYFSGEPETPHLPSTGFLQDWQVMKDKFEELERRIEEASRSHAPPDHHVLKDEAEAYLSKFERGNHPSIVKVIWENEGGLAHGIPHLIYVSREKRPKHPHHYKAGAMNVLTRVSGVMTNAPFMVNVDCDMFVNNPHVVLHAMCLLIGFDDDRKSGFVQFPQRFYGGLKDDPFGNQLVVLQQFTVTTGLGGLQGPVYQGTGCFHRRKVIYGEAPADLIMKRRHRGAAILCEDQIKGTVLLPSPQQLQRRFGSSKELQESAAEILTIPSTTSTAPSKTTAGIKGGLTATEAAAKQVASCTYELNTCWGKEVGWIYGSLTEDIQTGLRIHSLGWKTVALDTNPPAFLGSAPVGGPASMTQYKRWCTGLLETLVGRNRALLAAALMTKNNLSFRQCLVYLFVSTWGLRSVSELCYALLAPFCVFSNTSFLPKVSEPAFAIPALLFVSYSVYTLAEYLACGLSVRAWWNNQRMQRMQWTSSSLFGLLSVVAKFLGMSETTFEVTAKEQNTSAGGGGDGDDGDQDPGRFTFDSSPLFIPGTVVVLLNSAALVVGASKVIILGSVPSGMKELDSRGSAGIGELVCSALVVLLFWPFVRGLFGKGRYGLPWSTVLNGSALSSLFLLFCKWSS